jgi:hypothetical protein
VLRVSCGTLYLNREGVSTLSRWSAADAFRTAAVIEPGAGEEEGAAAS